MRERTIAEFVEAGEGLKIHLKLYAKDCAFFICNTSVNGKFEKCTVASPTKFTLSNR